MDSLLWVKPVCNASCWWIGFETVYTSSWWPLQFDLFLKTLYEWFVVISLTSSFQFKLPTINYQLLYFAIYFIAYNTCFPVIQLVVLVYWSYIIDSYQNHYPLSKPITITIYLDAFFVVSFDQLFQLISWLLLNDV